MNLLNELTIGKTIEFENGIQRTIIKKIPHPDIKNAYYYEFDDGLIERDVRIHGKIINNNAKIKEQLFQQLMAQISIYAGKKDGGLATLQDLYYKLKNNEEIICDCCGHKISGRGRHQARCEIVEHYYKCFNEKECDE